MTNMIIKIPIENRAKMEQQNYKIQHWKVNKRSTYLKVRYFLKTRQIIFLPFWPTFLNVGDFWLVHSAAIQPIISLQNSKKFAKNIKLWFDEFFENTSPNLYYLLCSMPLVPYAETSVRWKWAVIERATMIRIVLKKFFIQNKVHKELRLYAWCNVLAKINPCWVLLNSLMSDRVDVKWTRDCIKWSE